MLTDSCFFFVTGAAVVIVGHQAIVIEPDVNFDDETKLREMFFKLLSISKANFD